MDIGGIGLDQIDNGDIGNGISLRCDVSERNSWSVIGASVKLEGRRSSGTIQMDRNTPCSKIVHSQHTADDIPTHVIEDQHLPDGVAILIQDRGGVGDKVTLTRWVMG